MKRSALYLTIFVLVAFLSSVLITPAWAPPGKKPENISVGNTVYAACEGRFITELTAKFGFAQAGEHADFIIVLTLVIEFPGGTVETLVNEVALSTMKGIDPVPGDPVPLVPGTSPWDAARWRDSRVNVTATAELLAPGGNRIGLPATVSDEVFIPPPSLCQ